MPIVDTTNIAKRELFPGVDAVLIHTDDVTIAHVNLSKGAIVPSHSHVHEQIINVIEGNFEMTVGEETKIVTAGFIGIVPSNIPHAVTALSDGKIVDVFHPVREDLK